MLTSPPEFFQRVQGLKEAGACFVIATVIRVRGSASARTGSKAIFDAEGDNLYGYVGGGCAESHIAQEACEALSEQTPRIVAIDLDDEVFGLLPCGGTMDVYLEPHFASPVLTLPHLGGWRDASIDFMKNLGFHCMMSPDPAREPHSWREVFLELAQALADWNGHPLEPLRNSKGRGPCPLPSLPPMPSALLVFGRTRITEEFIRLLQFLNWRAQVFHNSPLEVQLPQLSFCEMPMELERLAIPEGAWVVIASHHKLDAMIAERALRAGAAYVGLVASGKRALLVVQDLLERQLPAGHLQRLCVPAGLNMPGDTPLQIAFSILCEILWAQKLASDSPTML